MNNKLILTVAVVALTSLVMLPCGVGIGFLLGISSTELGKELFEEMTEAGIEAVEEPADIANPQDLEGRLYRLKYPGNWMLDESNSDEADQYFVIYSPDNSYVTITVYDHSTDPQQNVDEAAESIVFSSPHKYPLEVWGEFFGEGVLLIDKYSRNATEARIFSHSNETSSFLVVEYRDSNLKQNVAPGFDMIAESFELIEP